VSSSVATTLIPRPALGTVDQPWTFRAGAVEVRAVEGLAMASLALRRDGEASFRAAAEAVFGAPLPGIGRAVKPGASPGALWIGPDQWMVVARDGGEDFAADLTARFGAGAAVTDQTDAWICLDLDDEDSGGTAIETLARLCLVDAERMDAGSVVRTSMHHMGCLLWCLTPKRSFRILGPRSSADSLAHAVTTAMRAVA
jgi:sarcosine oxidase subunit gamma